MPRRGSLGESEYTPDKQEILTGILAILCGIWRALITKRTATPPVVIFDLTAGDGFCSMTQAGKGSPLLICDQLTKHQLDYRAWFVERDPESYQRLTLSCHNNTRVQVVHADADSELAWFSGRTFLQRHTNAIGLIYADPTGARVPVDGINALLSSPASRMVDVLINVSATSTKRVDAKRVDDLVASINKKHWLIRKPHGQFQWTFLIGSNWDNFPRWQRRSFARLESEEGQRWLSQASLTATEAVSLRQATLPFDLTATIASISAIHGFLR